MNTSFNKTNDRTPAFPQTDTQLYPPSGGAGTFPRVQSFGGMSLRDFFAAHALQSLIAAKPYYGEKIEERMEPRHYAGDAYNLADAMIAEREKMEGK